MDQAPQARWSGPDRGDRRPHRADRDRPGRRVPGGQSRWRRSAWCWRPAQSPMPRCGGIGQLRGAPRPAAAGRHAPERRAGVRRLRPRSRRAGPGAARPAPAHARPAGGGVRLWRRSRSRQAPDHGPDRRGAGRPGVRDRRQPAQRGCRDDPPRHPGCLSGRDRDRRPPRGDPHRDRAARARRSAGDRRQGPRDRPDRRRPRPAVRRCAGGARRAGRARRQHPGERQLEPPRFGAPPRSPPRPAAGSAPGRMLAAPTGRSAACRSIPAACCRATCSSRYAAPTTTATTSSAQALERGAAAMVDRRPADLADDALAARGRRHHGGADARSGRAGRKRSRARIVAVTGSVGKTGTKEALRLALGAQAPTHASAASYNNHWGVPLEPGPRSRTAPSIAVFELGMNAPGEIGALTQIVRPHVALITTIAPAHLGFFEFDRRDRRSQGRDLSRAGAGRHRGAQCATMAISADSRSSRRAAGAAQVDRLRRQRCQLPPACSMPAWMPMAAPSPCSSMAGTSRFRVGAPGRHWVINSLAVLAAAAALGADVDARGRGAGRLRAAARPRPAAPDRAAGRRHHADRRQLQRQPGLGARRARRARHGARPQAGARTRRHARAGRAQRRAARGAGRADRGAGDRSGVHRRPRHARICTTRCRRSAAAAMRPTPRALLPLVEQALRARRRGAGQGLARQRHGPDRRCPARWQPGRSTATAARRRNG